MTQVQTETTRVSYKAMHEKAQAENDHLLRLLKNNREATAQLIALLNADGVNVESFAEGQGSGWDAGYRDGKKDAYQKYNRRIRRTASKMFDALTKDVDELTSPHQVGDCKPAYEKQLTDPKVHAIDRYNNYDNYACSNCKNDAYESHISRYQGTMRKDTAKALTAASDRSIKLVMKTTKRPTFGTEGVGVRPRVS
jgi:hypothetical protein